MALEMSALPLRKSHLGLSRAMLFMSLKSHIMAFKEPYGHSKDSTSLPWNELFCNQIVRVFAAKILS